MDSGLLIMSQREHGYTFPAEKLRLHRHDGVMEGGPPIVLVACGSFNPPTIMHLSMFEIATSELNKVRAHLMTPGLHALA